MSAFLSARCVSYRRRGRALVDAASIDLERGRVTVVIGPNGAGKSTLLRLLSGELTPDAGAVFCDGSALASLPPWSLACKRTVMTQSARLAFPFTVHEVTRLGVDGIGKGLTTSRRDRIVERCLATADVHALSPRRFDTLSGGEQRRVHFARALAQLEAGASVSERQALLLDEPVANLDLRHQLALLDAARRTASRGVAVLVVLHDLNLAARYADDLAVMRDGAVVARGAPAAVLSGDLLSDVFGVNLAVTNAPAGDGLFVTPSRWIEGEFGRSNQ